MKKKNAQVAMTALPARELTATKAEAKKLNPKPDEQNAPTLASLACKVAGTNVSTGNWKFKNADKHFPHDPVSRRVDRYFGNAVGGPLYVDYAHGAEDVKRCQKKAAILAQEGLRYCYIEDDMELEDVLAQLETQAA